MLLVVDIMDDTGKTTRTKFVVGRYVTANQALEYGKAYVRSLGPRQRLASQYVYVSPVADTVVPQFVATICEPK